MELSSNGEGETDAKGFTPSVKGKHPGNKQEVREFKTNWLGRHCIAILQYCNGQDPDILGSPCNPLEMSVNYTGNKDGNASEFTFTQISKGDDIGIYKGTIPHEEPVATVPASATEIPFKGRGQYQLSAGAAKIATIKGAKHGDLFTLLGVVSGVAPTIEKAGQTAFMLKNGKTFTASPGSQITFKAFDTGGGVIQCVEQSRFEV